MNIKDFLIDNYIWILVIILITIITIIGFLADKKKGGKKNQNVPPVNPNLNNQPVNNGMPMQYQQPAEVPQNQMNNNNMQMNYNNMNGQAPVNQNIPNNPSTLNNQNMGNNMNNVNTMMTEPQPVQVGPTNMMTMNNPQPVENVTPNVEQESMYQPLSEQKPVIAPQPVPDFSNMQNMNNQEMASPMMDTQLQQGTISFTPNQPMNSVTIPVTQVAPEPAVNQMTPYNMPSPMPIDNNQGMVSNVVPNNTTIPQPVSPQPIPVPQPVSAQNIMPNPYNNGQMMQPNYNQPTPSMPQQMPNEQAVSSPQPINFVYGPQNNNQNM